MTRSPPTDERRTEAGDDPHRQAIARFARQRGGHPVAAPTDDREQDALATVSDFWDELDALEAEDGLARLRQKALERLRSGHDAHHDAHHDGGAPVIGDEEPEDRPVLALMPAGGRRQVPYRALAAALVAVLALGGASWWSLRHPAAGPAELALRTIANGHGLPRSVRLADGTRLTLDADTSLRVADSPAGTREVHLDKGRAFFSVTHDAAHPFTVHAGAMTVTDLGTRFEVRTGASQTAVTLIEGQVAIAAPGSPALTMTPGTQLVLRGSEGRLEPVDTTRVVRWQSGMLDADDEPLGEVVARFNRYLDRPLAVGQSMPGTMTRGVKGAAPGDVRISGSFRLDDPAGFIEAIDAMGYPGLVHFAAKPVQKPVEQPVAK
ncbi:FecR domain-containing protein [Novosphingobium sp. 1949]|uniref:FecR domain-containing protein n=1 Tax=Novosphingobium organovorum TaxID=2930092 RepID=A0ABT0BJJ1_9SPHN|nr:FecR domain-containing protein [Novosphingobium organovorum]MCJ2185115.1 FecR domain-containing protein [Novosphingobium organovorum]